MARASPALTIVGLLSGPDGAPREAASMARHRSVGWFRKLLFAERYVPPPVIPARRRLMAMTDALTGTAHRVTDDAFAMGRRAGGQYVAVCGQQVLPASLTTPERDHCQRCERDSQLAQNAYS